MEGEALSKSRALLSCDLETFRPPSRLTNVLGMIRFDSYTFLNTPKILFIPLSAEAPAQFRIIKSSTPRPLTAPVFQQHQRSSRRGGSRHYSRPSTTTQLPSLQDIYNDYPDPESEFHADPIDIPITGKVRIHSDGYIECLDMGNFPHPYSCKKFISCAKMEYDSLLGWEYTCPKGLSFDPIGGICNWSAGLGCKE